MCTEISAVAHGDWGKPVSACRRESISCPNTADDKDYPDPAKNGVACVKDFAIAHGNHSERLLLSVGALIWLPENQEVTMVDTGVRLEHRGGFTLGLIKRLERGVCYVLAAGDPPQWSVPGSGVGTATSHLPS